MVTLQSKQLYGCEIVNDRFPKEFLDQCKIISNYPIIEVPIRQSGITRGEKRQCYYNANLLSQSYGGKAISGWAIDAPLDVIERKGVCIFLHGHSNWLTPEGKLVDVTKVRDKKSRYFLPTDIQLDLNGETYVETMKDFTWSTDRDDYLRELSHQTEMASKEFFTWITKWSKAEIDEKLDTHTELFLAPVIAPKDGDVLGKWNDVELEKWADENVVGKICDVMGFPYSIYDILNRTVEDHYGRELDIETRKVSLKCFNFYIKAVSKSHPKVKHWIFDIDWVQYCNKAMREANKTGKSIFEQDPRVQIGSIFERKYSIWKDRRMYKPSVCGISTTTGKTISEVPIQQDILEKQQLPRDKNTKKVVCTQARKYGLTPKEFLLMNNPKYYPHPYLVRKSGCREIPKIKLTSNTKSKGFG